MSVNRSCKDRAVLQVSFILLLIAGERLHVDIVRELMKRRIARKFQPKCSNCVRHLGHQSDHTHTAMDAVKVSYFTQGDQGQNCTNKL